MTIYNLKKTAMFLLMIPIFFIFFFFVGESTSTHNEGWIHALQLVPLIFLMLLAWKYPRPVGYILCFAGGILGVVYAFAAYRFYSYISLITVEISLFIPIVISGALLIFVTNKKNNLSSP